MTTYQQSETARISAPDTADETPVHRVTSAVDGGTGAPAVQGYDPADDGYSPARQRQRFGGTNWGAAFFGWMISVFVGVVLVGAVTAAVTGLGLTGAMVDGRPAEPTTPGLVAAASLFAALVVAYYSGGYVAGRMSRFDGGKQGVAVWVISLLLTGAGAGAGLLLGSQYVDLALPSFLPADLAAMQAVVAGVTALLSSLLAAVAGGKVGCRYHSKVDDAAYF